MGIKYPKCEKIDGKETQQMCCSFYRFSEIVRVLYMIALDDIEYSEDTVQKIIDLVYKRKIYFQVFHGVDEINELKEISLYCFWISFPVGYVFTQNKREIPLIGRKRLLKIYVIHLLLETGAKNP